MSEDTETTELDEHQLAMLQELAEVSDQLNELEERKKKLRDALTTELLLTGNDAVEIPDGRKAKVVTSERTEVNPVQLRTAIGDELWDRVTVRQLDMDKLEETVESGELDIDTVAACTIVTPQTPYIKISGRKKS